MAISKLEAAERQLNCAIKLYFAEEDLLAVHTLSRAAFRILHDLYPNRRDDNFEKDLEAEITWLGWRKFNRATNFLKHADDDPEDILDGPSEAETQMGIGFALILHCRIAGRYTPETAAFDMWMKSLNPEAFNVPPDPDPNVEEGSRRAVEYMKRDKPLRLLHAQALLTLFRKHPEYLPTPNLARRGTRTQS
jgi:hypothetical protein